MLIHRPILKRWIATGLVTGFAMTGFFLVCMWLHLAYITRLRFLNLLFITGAIWFVMRHYFVAHTGYRYLSVLLEGIKTSAVASGISCFFALIYLTFINPDFMLYLKTQAPLGEYMSPMLITIVLFTEQLSAAVIIALIVVQIFKPKSYA